LYAFTGYPLKLKKRGKPVLTVLLLGPFARISKYHHAYDTQELSSHSDDSNGDGQIREIERRPKAQADIIGYFAVH
jgi:hypothetical protein